MHEFRMPSLGADMEAGFLREWRVKPGDPVRRGDIIAEVETQKGIIEIEVFEEGTVGELLIQVDDIVPVGTFMTTILDSAETPAISLPARAEIPVESGLVDHPWESAVPPHPHHIRASPLAKKIATEKGIDISKVKGSGPEDAITREDIEKAVIEVLHAQPAMPTPKPTVTPVYEHIRTAVAAAMSKSNREIPHYYLQTKVDMSNALQWLADNNKQRSVKDRLLPVVLLIKAVAKALNDVPDLNAWWENGLQRKNDIHIGFVVSLRSGGIIVPAIHDAGKKSLDELMKMLSDLIPRARELKLRSSELADSTITITNLGDNAVETIFGIIYPPQVALVGFGGIHEEPWAESHDRTKTYPDR